MRGLLIVVLALPAHADPIVETRAAVAAEPDRPGLRLLLARHQRAAGQLAEAAATCEAIIERWPTAMRARLLLAEVRVAQGDDAVGRRHLRHVANHGAAPLALEAKRRLGEADDQSSRWIVRGAAGLFHDSALLPAGTEVIVPQAAWRATLAAETGITERTRTRRTRLLLGAERSAHLSDDPTVHSADRTAFWLDGRFDRPGLAGRVGMRADGALVLAGREADAHHGGVGSALTWWRPGDGVPWAQLGGRWLRYTDRDEGRGELSAGYSQVLGRVDLGARGHGTWVGPDEDTGFLETGADLRLGWTGRWFSAQLRGGAAGRFARSDREVRPRASAGMTWSPSPHLSLSGTAAWQAARRADDGAYADRIVAGLSVEVSR